MYKVFVYGSLKKGFHNHLVMLDAGGQFVKEDSIKGKLFNTGFNYPAVIPGDDTIHGEIYEVEDITYLDGLEGYNVMNPERSHYIRKTVKTHSGEYALVYFYNLSTDHMEYIKEGIWTHELAESSMRQFMFYSQGMR